MSNQYRIISNIQKSINDPNKAINKLSQIKTKLKFPIHRAIDKPNFNRKYDSGIDVMSHEWDNLIILDACRHDIFSEVNHIGGDLQQVVSNASHSIDFIESNFNGGRYHDTIYCTANTHAEKIYNGTFFKVVKTYDVRAKNSIAKNRTRAPERVYELALEEYDTHPDKRLIIHFMQPHSPYIGPKAAEIRDRLTDEKNIMFKYWSERSDIDDFDGMIFNDLLDAAAKGIVTNEEIYTAYTENLEIVLEWVENLLEKLDGTTIITSDHGELLGSSSGIINPTNYFHYQDMYVPELRLVPWLEIKSEYRRKIESDKPISTTSVDEDIVTEQLKDLGYL